MIVNLTRTSARACTARSWSAIGAQHVVGGYLHAVPAVFGRLGRSEVLVALAAGGLDQPVQRVIGVVAMGLDLLVAEPEGLLRVVADVGDIAGGVVGVVQALQGLRPARARG